MDVCVCVLTLFFPLLYFIRFIHYLQVDIRLLFSNYFKDGSAICSWDTQSWVGGKNVRTNHPGKILKNISYNRGKERNIKMFM